MRRTAACLLAVLLLGTASFAAEAPDIPTGSRLYLENKSTSDESQLFTELFREKLTKDESKGVYSKPGFPVVDKKEEATYVLRFLFVMRENQKSFGGEAQEHVRVNLWLLDSRGTVIWEHNYDCIRVFREPARECYQHISDDLKAAQVNAEGKRAGWLGWRKDQAAASQTPTASMAQEPTQRAVQPQPTQTTFASTKGLVLEDETPVRLRLNRTVSSADAHVGESVDFEVLDDITVDGTLVIPKGGLAFATVTEAQAKRRMARGGKLDINIDYVKLASGEKAALRAVKGGKGGGHTGGMVGGMVATSLVFFPAAPFFLFMHGKDISIPKGTEITAYVNGDMKLDIAKFQPAAPANTPAQKSVAASAASENVGFLSAKLHLESDPSGADIEVDGSFVGNTPSDVQVTEGEHTVSVQKTGFKDWERKLKVSGGSSVHLDAELEKVTNQ